MTPCDDGDGVVYFCPSNRCTADNNVEPISAVLEKEDFDLVIDLGDFLDGLDDPSYVPTEGKTDRILHLGEDSYRVVDWEEFKTFFIPRNQWS
jgi:hypothetical protein